MAINKAGKVGERNGVQFNESSKTASENKELTVLQQIVNDYVSNGDDISILTNDVGYTTYGSGNFDTDFGNKTTNDLNEGSNNLYYTQSRVDDKSIEKVTSDYTITVFNKTILVDASGGNVIITLPDPARTIHKIYNIKKIDDTTNTVTFTTPSGIIEFGNNIDLANRGEVVNLQHDGTDYYLIA